MSFREFLSIMFTSTVFWCLLALHVLPDVKATCEMDASICEFWLEVGYKLTMTSTKKAVFPHDGKLFYFDTTNTSTENAIDDVSGIISADGWEVRRLVIVANGTLPGPPIEVYEGQTIIIHVKNTLPSESITIHWHGLHQSDTPWMDGVAFVSQCPIEPEQTFSYRFTAKPKGTFWYHSHIGVQRTMGLYGAFIIREKTKLKMDEFIVVLNDWNHHWDSNEAYYRMTSGIYENRVKLNTTDSLDGAHFSLFQFHSGLINGKGRYYKNGNHNGAPLHVFKVQNGNQYRFRSISAGSLYPFRISIDNHNITVVASDGYDLEPITAESVIINPGERYDFYITADQAVGNYWVRAVTLEVNVNHSAEAILRYEGADNGEPSSNKKLCSESDPCLVVNCPFKYYPKSSNTKCVAFDELRSAHDNDPAPTGQIEERFLNFAFPGSTATPGSVNGRAFHPPAVSAVSQPHQLEHYRCGDDCGEQKICKCFHTLNLDHGKVYQITFTNMGIGRGWSHPIHMHGHSFYVVKIGYGSYNEITGQIMDENMEVDCRGGVSRNVSYCNGATWSNTSWSGDNIPGLELKNPPRKDTIIVPTGGYVVVRIRADNPGVWFMHCHIEIHNMDGMAMVLNESFSHHAKPPAGFPKCGDFNLDYTFTEPIEANENSSSMVTLKQFWVVSGVLAGIIFGLMLIIILMILCKEKSTANNPEYNNKTSN